MWINFILFVVLISVSFLYYFLKFRDWNRVFFELGFKKIGVFNLVKYFLFCFAGLFLLSFFLGFLFLIFGFNDLSLVHGVIKIIFSSDYRWLIFGLIFTVFAEEVFFRGLLVNKFGIFFSSLFFSLWHSFYGSFNEVFGAFVLGMWLGFIYKKSGSLFVCLLGHWSYNLVMILLLFSQI